MIKDADPRWDGKGHVFAAAAEAMRRIIIEHARRKHALKRGGEHRRVEFDEDFPPIASPCNNFDDLLALDEALERLPKQDAPKATLPWVATVLMSD